MNQILISEKLYITPELKRKKKMYKIDFFISVFFVVILFSYYIYAEYDKTKAEAKSQDILSSVTFEENLVDDTTIKFTDSTIVVILNTEDPTEVIYSEPVVEEPSREEVIDRNTQITESGQEYYTCGIIKIPKINLEYPVLNTTTDELLKISPTRFWGQEQPNEVGGATERLFCRVFSLIFFNFARHPIDFRGRNAILAPLFIRDTIP